MARGAAFTTSLTFHAGALALVVLVPVFRPGPVNDTEPPTPLRLWPTTKAVVRADSRPAAQPARPARPRSPEPADRPTAPEKPVVDPTLPPQAASSVRLQEYSADDNLTNGPGTGLGTGTGGERDDPGPGSGAASGEGGQPRRVGGDLQPPAKVFHVKPEYPPLARAARVQGSVVLECTIDPAGNVSDVRVVSGHPLLARAAVDAVGRWRYSPTRLNGQPVPVLLTVTLRFDLTR